MSDINSINQEKVPLYEKVEKNLDITTQGVKGDVDDIITKNNKKIEIYIQICEKLFNQMQIFNEFTILKIDAESIVNIGDQYNSCCNIKENEEQTSLTSDDILYYHYKRLKDNAKDDAIILGILENGEEIIFDSTKDIEKISNIKKERLVKLCNKRLPQILKGLGGYNLVGGTNFESEAGGEAFDGLIILGTESDENSIIKKNICLILNNTALNLEDAKKGCKNWRETAIQLSEFTTAVSNKPLKLRSKRS